MKKIAFSQLDILPHVNTTTINCGDNEIEVLDYLSIEDKTKLLQFVVNGALDEMTGTFSPLRVEVYFAIGICKWYAGISFTQEDMEHIAEVYDALDTNNLITNIMDSIPESELIFIKGLVEETIADIARYNTSAAGIIQNMSNSATGLDEQITAILEKIKNSEGLEQLAVIKDVVGKD